MSQQPNLSQYARQDQRLIMSAAMEKAFHVLQMPTQELSDWLENEIEQNPLLDISHFQAKGFDPALICSKPSLYSHLLKEISLHFSSEEDKQTAQFLAGSIDENGFLTLTPEELIGKEEILKAFQQMEPRGIGARNIQEALLIQLEEKKGSPIYTIVSEYYEDLLHCRLKKIGKGLKLTEGEVKEFIHTQLRPLNPYPGRGFHQEINPILTADVTIYLEEGIWNVEVNDSSLPTFQIHPFYLSSLEEKDLKREESEYIRRHLAAGKWLIRTLDRRKKTLQAIAAYFLKREKAFLEGLTDTPTPLTMRTVAQALNLSESTITRAIANKALATPRGLLTFRSFFTRGISSEKGEISNQEAKNLLLKLIKQEEKPLSDASLSQELLARGIHCARRTVTKYRKQLKIGSASQRKMRKSGF